MEYILFVKFVLNPVTRATFLLLARYGCSDQLESFRCLAKRVMGMCGLYLVKMEFCQKTCGACGKYFFWAGGVRRVEHVVSAFSGPGGAESARAS